MDSSLHQAPPSVGFSRQEYWSGLPFPSPGHLPNPGIEPRSPALAGGFFTTEPPGKPILYIAVYICQSKFPSSSYVHVPLSEDIKLIRTSLVAQTVKCLSTMRETWVLSLGREDSLEKEMATHSSTLTWKIPRTEELGAGYFPWGRKESGTTERLHFHFPFIALITVEDKF